jgi:hypothetical protein
MKCGVNWVEINDVTRLIDSSWDNMEDGFKWRGDVMTELDTEAGVINHIASRWLATYPPEENNCVLAARVLVVVCEHFKVAAREVPVNVQVFNQEAAVQMFAGVADPSLWPASAEVFATSIAPAPGGGFGGHLIVETDHYLVDLTAGQFNRPNVGIETGEVIVEKSDQPVWAENNSVALPSSPNGTLVAYTWRDDQSYLLAPDWKTGYRDPAQALIDAMTGYF